MKILLANYSRRRIAGIETYLADLLEELERRGIEAGLLSETDEPKDRAPIEAAGLRDWCGKGALAEVKRWGPTAVLVNGRMEGPLETSLQDNFPCAYFIHNYYGTCISGFKTHRRPSPEPCSRTLGAACLALYLPRGCGGNNPLTMFQLYGQETARQRRLHRYPLLVTHSAHMREEYLRHGFGEEQVKVIPFACHDASRLVSPAAAQGRERRWEEGPVKLLFAGRMERIKGGAELIAAAAQLPAKLNRPVELTMAGDGEMREAWREAARQAAQNEANFACAFPGWLSGEGIATAYRDSHLFVMPSLWPEPFGKGGMEAACQGCPSVGFRIGGIPQWLADGVGGYLADWREDPARHLADAMRRALEDREHYYALRRGARTQAERFTTAAHCEELLPLLTGIAK